MIDGKILLETPLHIFHLGEDAKMSDFAGTLMIEPTESESKHEIDRFISAMKVIRAEIANIESGMWPADDNPLVNAPHTCGMLTADKWTHP